MIFYTLLLLGGKGNPDDFFYHFLSFLIIFYHFLSLSFSIIFYHRMAGNGKNCQRVSKIILIILC